MDSIQIMMEEHKNIVRLTNVCESACYKILLGEEINQEDFADIIVFVRKYADEHHHGKEEKFLFKAMLDNLGVLGTKLITNGMLVEHDFGRLHIMELEKALKEVADGDDKARLRVISNMIGYVDLIRRHASKEDELIYSFGAKNLGEEIMAEVNRQSEEFERVEEEKGTQKKYLDMLDRLEEKYI